MSDYQDETELIGALMGLPIFADLDYADIKKLLSTCERYDVEVGAVLCEPDTIDESLTIFLGGKLRLETREGDKLADATQLRVFGEMGVFTGQPRSSRVLAEEASDVLILQGTALQDLAEENSACIYWRICSRSCTSGPTKRIAIFRGCRKSWTNSPSA